MKALGLAHKTEAGGVLLNIADEPGLKTAWQQLHANIGRHAPDPRFPFGLQDPSNRKPSVPFAEKLRVRRIVRVNYREPAAHRPDTGVAGRPRQPHERECEDAG